MGLLSLRSWSHRVPLPSPLSGHLFDLTSLSGRAGFTAAYSEKGLVYISVCGENENCSPGVGKGCPSSLPSACLSLGSPLSLRLPVAGEMSRREDQTALSPATAS